MTNTKELTSIIYDTLMQDKHFPQFNLADVEHPEVNALQGIITFEYEGVGCHVTVQATKDVSRIG